MNKKVIGFFVCILLILTLLPSMYAANPDDFDDIIISQNDLGDDYDNDRISNKTIIFTFIIDNSSTIIMDEII